MSVVTKTGDKGETGLLSGERVSKTHPRVETYGTLDELVSHIGWVRSLNPHDDLVHPLKLIQVSLFRLGAELASSRLDPKWHLTPMSQKDVDQLESWVKHFEPKLNLPRSFVLPGGTPVSASLDMARTVARRLERLIMALKELKIYENPEALKYINRLSDLLFVFARYEQKMAGKDYEPV
ncbi:MAG: ATP:cob(I)alamin adenosyltransferase [Deltaproteobacteria bacterium RIFCSPLOWO2_12_FULL_44_12]|nr:MAG: ATP:cob(I)alamin adenosyltransferase [Deltaproteobacteria bacterium RIFCSPHIGHO2_01_FULL_43_49]OGQ16693.1 MAG: ATP:cob(I)alamin adenosyltransferase [Deltaproteobacteria bacterium RIFCSPHIGHO2_02_FULL_44_53]OGQ29831.1 MAG: ATP:cob(I)alamin adenosyltransferase [Deltaproteobacteria bacterium RIFCSPHIGHO2_12_FULL_44_21]OGQ33121.1 MAG: ATP:cob(I)alamin adenosyltransferase [Deltaproteobacteria bacterium RIFCSPLOWO2_01_FULL_45_74]OGQ42216.1 MAG: ATP:cob(I)alamin adenosyltransferase [Deltaprote